MPFLLNLFYILAFFAGTFVAWKFFRQENYEEEKVIDLVLFATLVGIFAGRLFYLLSNRIFNFSLLIFNFSSGFNFDAGLFTTLLFTLFFLRRNKWPLFPALDFLGFGAAVAVSIVQVGLLLTTPSLRHLLLSVYLLQFVLALFVLRQNFYQKGRLFSLALLATLRPLPVLTGVIIFYIIEGKEYVAEFGRGFREGMRGKIRNSKS